MSKEIIHTRETLLQLVNRHHERIHNLEGSIQNYYKDEDVAKIKTRILGEINFLLRVLINASLNDL